MGFWPTFKTTETPDKFIGFMTADACMSFRHGTMYLV